MANMFSVATPSLKEELPTLPRVKKVIHESNTSMEPLPRVLKHKNGTFNETKCEAVPKQTKLQPTINQESKYTR